MRFRDLTSGKDEDRKNTPVKGQPCSSGESGMYQTDSLARSFWVIVTQQAMPESPFEKAGRRDLPQFPLNGIGSIHLGGKLSPGELTCTITHDEW